MARRSLRVCKQRGCNELTRDKIGYCGLHIDTYREKKLQREKEYDKRVRYSKDKQYAKFYRSKGWIRLREYILTLYNGIDIYSYYVDNNVVTANTVHHIMEIKDNWEKRLEIDNMFTVSETSHNRIHTLYRKDKEGTQEILREMLKRYRDSFGISPLP